MGEAEPARAISEAVAYKWPLWHSAGFRDERSNSFAFGAKRTFSELRTRFMSTRPMCAPGCLSTRLARFRGDSSPASSLVSVEADGE